MKAYFPMKPFLSREITCNTLAVVLLSDDPTPSNNTDDRRREEIINISSV